MNDLDERLRSLAERAVPGPATPDDLRRRAADRRTRKARASWGVTTLVLVLTASLIGWQATKQDDGTTLEPAGTTTSAIPPAPTTTPSTVPGTRTLGDVSGVAVTVEPATNLGNGQIVRVRVDGLAHLPGPILAICAADADQQSAMTGRCDPEAVSKPSANKFGQVPATGEQDVAVARVLSLSTDKSGERYDCAARPCSFAVGTTMTSGGVRAVLVPISFRPTPLSQPLLSLDRATDLRGGEEVGLNARALTPNMPYNIRMCRLAPDGDPTDCDVVGSTFDGPPAADANGVINGRVRTWAGVFSYGGRNDCTRERCAVVLQDRSGTPLARVDLAFASDVVAWTPQLRIVEPAPYRHGQTVTVRGTGFRPGLDLRTHVGLCPADKNTAFEERCTYGFTPAVVADDGTFTKEVTLPSGGCELPPGCHIGWVIPKGVTVGATPVLQFVP